MATYIIRRTLYMIPILLGVTLLTFLLFNYFGGDPAIRYAGKSASPERLAQIREELGLTQGMLGQYGAFLKQIVTLDFGRSWSTKQEISNMISDGIGATLSLTVPAFLASVFLALVLSMWTAYRRGSVIDKTTMVSCLGMLSISSLAYVLGLQYLLGYKLGVFPISGWEPSWIGRWEYLGLPIVILVALLIGPKIMIYRTVIIEEGFQDYVRTAKAKGLSLRQVYGKHILKNAMIPIITLLVIEMPFLITGSVVIENFFGIPGIGGITIKALNESDFPVIKAMTVMSAILYMVFNLLSDVLYAAVDPRIKLG